MYKIRTCRIAIRSVRPTSVTFRDPLQSISLAQPPMPFQTHAMRCAICARWAGPRYNWLAMYLTAGFIVWTIDDRMSVVVNVATQKSPGQNGFRSGDNKFPPTAAVLFGHPFVRKSWIPRLWPTSQQPPVFYDSASEIIYIVSGGALNSTHSLSHCVLWSPNFYWFVHPSSVFSEFSELTCSYDLQDFYVAINGCLSC